MNYKEKITWKALGWLSSYLWSMNQDRPTLRAGSISGEIDEDTVLIIGRKDHLSFETEYWNKL
jgi:hypothetical protein